MPNVTTRHAVSLLALFAAVGLFALAASLAPAQEQDADAGSAEGTYKVDPVHTSIYFKIMHLNVAYVYGRFNDVQGEYTLGDAPSFAFTVQAESVDTNNEQRDNHLRSDDFFNVAEHPAITFTSTAVETNDAGYAVTGDLSLHGQTREITVDIAQTGAGTGNQGELRAGLHTTFTIKRSDYGMTQLMGPVGDEVTLMISLEGVRE